MPTLEGGIRETQMIQRRAEAQLPRLQELLKGENLPYRVIYEGPAIPEFAFTPEHRAAYDRKQCAQNNREFAMALLRNFTLEGSSFRPNTAEDVAKAFREHHENREASRKRRMAA